MTQPTLFATPASAPRVRCNGRTPISRACSREAGEHVQATGAAFTQRARLRGLLLDWGAHGVTDAEASERLGILRHTVPARRAELAEVDRIVAIGRRNGATVWMLARFEAMRATSEAHQK